MSYTFPYDRLKLLVLTLASLVLTAAVGGAFALLFVAEGEAAEVLRETTGMGADTGAAASAIVAVILASGLGLTAARFFMRAGPVLTVDEQGILDRRVGRRIPWTDVRTVELRGRGMRAFFAVALHPEGRGRRRKKGAEVRVNVGALRCRAEDVALAIHACGGYPVLRRDAR
ncbi:hypothetical protein [Caenispirillum salinarum]|uniref:hypothetical protein n=1 Tax=Caenispirillum salinarum TaxID=859058 RepID=UPI00384C8DAC